MDAQQPADARCAGEALLVGTHAWLPSEPTERLISDGEVVGCNRLFCSACRSWVRHLDDLRLKVPLPRTEIEALFVDPRADKHGGFRRGVLGFRVYLCRCACIEVSGSERSLAGTWSCAGHPAAVATEAPPLPATDAELEALLRWTANRPPNFGDDQSWDFVLRWRPPALFARVWPIVDKLLLDPDPHVRACALELVNAWTAGASTTISRLISIARVRADAYPEPALRADLARTLVNLSVTVRSYRPAIAAAIVEMLGKSSPPRGTAVFLSEYEPEAVVISARAWTASDDDQAAAESAAGAMAMYRRDHLLALLAALSVRNAASRAEIAKQVVSALEIPDEKLRLILAADEIPLPTTRPTLEQVRAALRLS